METWGLKSGALALLPALLMCVPMLLGRLSAAEGAALWQRFTRLSAAALLATLAVPAVLWLGEGLAGPRLDGWVALGPFTAAMAVLVQAVGTVIGVFSSRYLQGEAGQRGYVSALSGLAHCFVRSIKSRRWGVCLICVKKTTKSYSPFSQIYLNTMANLNRIFPVRRI